MSADIIDITALLKKRKEAQRASVGVQAVDGNVCVIMNQRAVFHEEDGTRSYVMLTLKAAYELLDLVAEGIIDAEEQASEK